MKSKPVYLPLLFIAFMILGCSLDIRDERGFSIFWYHDLPPSYYLVQSMDGFSVSGRNVKEGIYPPGTLIENPWAHEIVIYVRHAGSECSMTISGGGVVLLEQGETMAVLTFTPMTQVGYGPAQFIGKAALTAGQYVAFKTPSSARAFARLMVDVPSSGTFTVEQGGADEDRIAAGTQILMNPYGANLTTDLDDEFTPAGIFVVTCVSGAVNVEMEAK